MIAEVKVILQARMSSTRLPGKSMMRVNNEPLIYYLIESLTHAVHLEDIVVATSLSPANDPIRSFCKTYGVACFSGDENDVASRFVSILESSPSTFFHRLCGDSPYYDHHLIEHGNALVADKSVDVVTSMPNKGYPMGCNIEMFRTQYFLDAIKLINDPRHREHVTSSFYSNPESSGGGRMVTIKTDDPRFGYDKYKFSVDTPEDFELAKRMLSEMNFKPWNYNFEDKLTIQDKIKACL